MNAFQAIQRAQSGIALLMGGYTGQHAPKHRFAPYYVEHVDGWWYVRDRRTGERSRPVMSETEANIQLHALRVRNLINE